MSSSQNEEMQIADLFQGLPKRLVQMESRYNVPMDEEEGSEEGEEEQPLIVDLKLQQAFLLPKSLKSPQPNPFI